MFSNLLRIFLSLLVFDLFFTSSFTYARYLIKHSISSTFIDPTINNDSRIVEKTFKFPSLPTSQPSIEELGHYAGYYSLPNTVGARMFYFFFKSRNSEVDPIVIWLSGGPGFSSTTALFCENGPFYIRNSSLVRNDYGWDEVSNILFIDQPIGTGFSYSTNNNTDLRHNLIDVTNDLYDFLQAFFNEHPNFVQNDFFITGESFAGHYVPALASRIHQENKANNKIHINLKGFAIGNGLVNPRIQYETLPYYAKRCNLIGEQDFLHIKETMVPRCRNATEHCDMGSEVDCLIAFDICDGMFQEIMTKTGNINYYDFRKPREGPLNYDYSHIENFLNNQEVKDVLGVPDIPFVSLSSTVYEAMKGEFMRSYDVGIPALLEDGIKLLIYVGEYDFICNFIGNIKWVVEMPWYGNQAFRESTAVPFLVGGSEMGALRSHGPLSFLKIYDAGHMVPMDQPKTALYMIQKWMQGEL